MICSKCKGDKSEEEFGVDTRYKRGRGYYCKSCLSSYHKELHIKNPEPARQRAKDWAKNNKDKFNANGKRYRDNHVNEERLRAKEKYKKYKYRWKIYKANRRALEQACEGTYTWEDIQQLFSEQDSLCLYCKKELDTTYHIDHKTPLSRGGANSKENLALTCPNCNLKKHTKTAEEYMESLCILS